MLAFEIFSAFLIGCLLSVIFALLVGGKAKTAAYLVVNSLVGMLLSLLFAITIPSFPYTRLGNFFTGIGGVPVALCLLFYSL